MGYTCLCFVLAVVATLPTAHAQRFNLQSYEIKTIESSNTDGTCPSSDVREGVRSNITQDIRTTLQNLTANIGGTAVPPTTTPLPSSTVCGGVDGWNRIVHLNMSDPSQQCPTGWTFVTYNGLRLCGRPLNAAYRTCESANFSAGGQQYTEVCGRAVGYQFGDPVAFALATQSIDGYYLDGLTLTHGVTGSRAHIWSFVNGLSEDRNGRDACPCAPNWSGATVPSFVGSNYFCESGTATLGFIFHNEPLWDGDGCLLPANTCCSYNSPPYFTTLLPAPTSDDIEGRLCGYQNRDSSGQAGTLIQLLEVYIK